MTHSHPHDFTKSHNLYAGPLAMKHEPLSRGHTVPVPRQDSIAVCICTFQRNHTLLSLLASLDKQVFCLMPTRSVCIIVADNSPAGDAAALCKDRTGLWPLHYLHEPQPGISHARNAALAAVPDGTGFIAMIDDDEEPAPDWLDQLLYAQAQSSADVVAGPTVPVFPQGTPEWIAASGFFCRPADTKGLLEAGAQPPAATCNVLVRASLLGPAGVLFDPALALCGGEDSLLFRTLKRRGCRFAWAAAACVTEWIPPERANLAYMCRESYRRGAVRYYVKSRQKGTSTARSLRMALRLSVNSLARIAWDMLRMLTCLGRDRRAWAPIAIHLAGSLGLLAGVLHIPNRHYRTGASAC